jgi:hypothetical protein
MAISQSKYIRISTDAGTASLGSRDFSGLVFTATAMLTTAPATAKTAYDTNGDVVGLSLVDVKNSFGINSVEFKFAERYFGYVSRDGSSPSILNFCKVGSDETPSAALARVNDISNNFGSFTFLNSDTKAFTDDELSAVAGVNSAYDHRYLFSVGFEFDSTADSSTKMEKFSAAKGTFVYFGSDAYGAALAMAITASVNWAGRNSTVNFMFKQIPGEVAVITNDTDFESMKDINANFYGLTQTNGKSLSFLQLGYNSDGEDAGVYINEMWLKSAIATDFMELCLSRGKIPANSDGVAMIRAAIYGDIQDALRNGTILPNKNIDEEDRAEIYRYTGVATAADEVATFGYYLFITIEKDEGGDYVAYYHLVYSKGDGVRFCDGHHKLI